MVRRHAHPPNLRVESRCGNDLAMFSLLCAPSCDCFKSEAEMPQSFWVPHKTSQPNAFLSTDASFFQLPRRIVARGLEHSLCSQQKQLVNEKECPQSVAVQIISKRQQCTLFFNFPVPLSIIVSPASTGTVFDTVSKVRSGQTRIVQSSTDSC
jgi:hypothetical protein